MWDLKIEIFKAGIDYIMHNFGLIGLKPCLIKKPPPC